MWRYLKATFWNHRISLSYTTPGRIQDGLRILTPAMKDSRPTFETAIVYASALMLAGDMNRAVEAHQTVLKLDPTHVATYCNLGVTLSRSVISVHLHSRWAIFSFCTLKG